MLIFERDDHFYLKSMNNWIIENQPTSVPGVENFVRVQLPKQIPKKIQHFFKLDLDRYRTCQYLSNTEQQLEG